MTDHRPDAHQQFIAWVRLACPVYGLEVGKLLDQPALPIVVCARCSSRPHLERTAP